MKRRDCLKLTALSAGAVLSSSTVSALVRLQVARRRFGLQLFTVREQWKNAPVQTIEAVARMGFKEIEMFGFGRNIFVEDPLHGLSPRELKRVLDDCGLSIPTTTITADVDIPGVAKIAHELGIRYLTVAMAPEMITVTWDSVILSGVTGVEQLTIIADRLNKLGRESKENGLGLAYHNHQMEFTPLKELRGTLAFDFLMQETDPELVKIEFDVGWLTSAQVDPIEYLLDYGDRVIAVRLKDFNPALPIGQGLTRFPIPIMSRMVELGTGVVDFKRVLAVMDEIGVAHKFVQIDVTATPMETAKRSHEYLDSISA